MGELTSGFSANHNGFIKLISLIVILEPESEHPTLHEQNSRDQRHASTMNWGGHTHVSRKRMEERNQHLVVRTCGHHGLPPHEFCRFLLMGVDLYEPEPQLIIVAKPQVFSEVRGTVAHHRHGPGLFAHNTSSAHEG